MTSSHSLSLQDIHKNIKKENNKVITINKINPNNILINYENINEINTLIDTLREQDFDKYYMEDGKKVLLKYHNENTVENTLNPISPYEEKIQGLLFLRGMLLISEQLGNQAFTSEIIQKKYADYQNNTLLLASEFNKLLMKKLGLTHEEANTQLTMAKDLSILLTKHPAICTISETNDKVTMEKSTPYQVSAEYYGKIFANIDDQKWFKSAKSLAGLKGKESWLDIFFKNPNNRKTMIDNGVSVPPSARWLPIPANNQIVEITVAKKENNQIKENSIIKTDFLRTGIAIAYDVRKLKKPEKVQKEIAEDILQELIKNQLDKKINNFKMLYDGWYDFKDNENPVDFYIDYQTLLSPLIGEENFTHVDNNAKFIKLVKEVIDNIKENNNFNFEGINVIIEHTNSAVNRNAHLTNEASEDKASRLRKIEQFKKHLSKNKDKPKSKELKNELALRTNACNHLRELLLFGDVKGSHYFGLDRYQRNIMIAALERLAMGNQCVSLAGCKSARDRTGVFASALKVMLETPIAMEDWELLEAGIGKTLKQGHAFRSMIFHNAIVKVSLVHKRFMEMLNPSIQKEINSLLVFARKLPEYKDINKNEQKINTNELMGKLNNLEKANNTKHQNAPLAITQNDADFLLNEIQDTNKNKVNNTEWEIIYHDQDKLHSFTNPKDLDKYLADLRNSHLDRESYVITTPTNLPVRVFPKKDGNVHGSVSDLFASGIDSLRGALLIIEEGDFNELKTQNDNLDKLKKEFKDFHEKILKIEEKNKNQNETENDKLKKLKNAYSAYEELNSKLAHLLVKSKHYKEENLALKGILEARDLLWIQSRRNEAVCVVSEGALSFSKRCEFSSPNINNAEYKTQNWFIAFNKKHPWAEKFFESNKDILNLSSTPMQRSLPNPANAWEEATILLNDEGRVEEIINGIRLGITSPYQVQDRNERQRMTVENHALMLTDENLKKYAKTHIERWGGDLLSIDDNKTITIPILHQTLVDPGALRYAGDRTGFKNDNPKGMMILKNIANQALQNEYLNYKEIYFNQDTKDIVTEKPESGNYLTIKFNIKETNNGINISEKVTTKTEQDIEDSRSLIDMTIEKLILFKKNMENPEEIENINKIINYLNSSSPKNPRQMDDKEKAALKTSCDLMNNTNKNLSLLVQAAVNLASFMSDDINTSLIGFIRDGTALIDNKHFKPKDLNDSTYKSCYERILAELLGVRMGGCKSALDREQEISELTLGMYKQFNQEKQILNYHDDIATKNKFINTYVTTRRKHILCKMITGSLGSSDLETQGLAYHKETSFEKKVSVLFNKCRHPSYKKPLDLKLDLKSDINIDLNIDLNIKKPSFFSKKIPNLSSPCELKISRKITQVKSKIARTFSVGNNSNKPNTALRTFSMFNRNTTSSERISSEKKITADAKKQGKATIATKETKNSGEQTTTTYTFRHTGENYVKVKNNIITDNDSVKSILSNTEEVKKLGPVQRARLARVWINEGIKQAKAQGMDSEESINLTFNFGVLSDNKRFMKTVALYCNKMGYRSLTFNPPQKITTNEISKFEETFKKMKKTTIKKREKLQTDLTSSIIVKKTHSP